MRSTRFMVLVVALLAFLPACTNPHSDRAADVASLTARLSAQADAWDKAIVRKDRAAIEANMAEDFRQIDGAGNTETKASFVNGIVSPDLEIDPYTRYQGSPFTSHYRYIDIYARQGDDWKIVSVQITRMPDEAPAE